MADRVIVITGTRKGLGRYLAEWYVGKGDLVVGCSRQIPDWRLENYIHLTADVANEKEARQVISSTVKLHGRIDALINNAGVAAMNPVLLTPLESARKIVDTNFLGTFLFSREAAKTMQRQRFGRIVNIGTVAVPLQLEGEAVYAASKSAVVTLTEILARELGAFGITCNCVAAPPMDSDLIRGISEEKIDAIIERLAIKRKGQFEDVANVIDFFLQPASGYVTGQVITLGGLR